MGSLCKMECWCVFLISFLFFQPSLCQDTNSTSTTTFSATDCLSYIYVAWVFFIYAVGLGLESSQYPQVISYVYLYIPDDCGGNFEGNDAISAQNLLNILLASTNIYGNSFNQNPFPGQFGQNQNPSSQFGQNQNPSSQFGQNQASSATNLISSLSGIFRSSPQVVHNLKTSSSLARGGLQTQSYKKSFKLGKKNLRRDKSLYKYVKKIRNPFNGHGQATIKNESVNKQITKTNRKIPCSKLAKQNEKAVQICKSIRIRKRKGRNIHKRKKNVSLEKKMKQRKENTKETGFIQKLSQSNPF